MYCTNHVVASQTRELWSNRDNISRGLKDNRNATHLNLNIPRLLIDANLVGHLILFRQIYEPILQTQDFGVLLHARIALKRFKRLEYSE